MRGAHRTENRPRPCELDRLVPGDGRRRDQVRAPGQHLRRRIDRQRPLAALPVVARVGRADAGAGERLPVCGVVRIVERRKAALAGHLPDMRVVDHDEIVAARQLLDGVGLEILQRPLVPSDLDARPFAPQFRAGDQRSMAARMAPRHAVEDDVQPPAPSPSAVAAALAIPNPTYHPHREGKQGQREPP